MRNTINYKQYEIAQKCNLLPKNNNGIIKIVYQCGTKSHDKDFKVCEKALIDIMKDYPNTEFYLIGDCTISKEFEKYSNRLIKKDFMPYDKLLEYISTMDINIAPLEIKQFNECKSELKLFESALVKLPSIVSPTTPYKSIVKNGVNGYLAATTEDWYSCFKNLIEKADFRKNIGEQAYKDFVPMFYIENNIDTIINSYKEIISNHKN